MKKIAVLASGRGSNFQAVLDSIAAGKINGECIALLTDNKDSYSIERAKNAGIPAIIHNFKDYPDKASFEADLLASMKETGADLFVCAGYMRIIGPEIARTFAGRMLNIHPALLPAFPGLHEHPVRLSDLGRIFCGCAESLLYGICFPKNSC